MQYFIQATFSKARALVTRRSVFGFAMLLGLSGCQMIKPAPRPQIAIGQQISSPSQYGLDMKDWETQDWKIAQPRAHLPVSYTHLTLPTIYPVYISVVAVSFKKKHSTSYR